ncbi:MAG: alkaline phosphatase family protein [Candidatus Woesearchaeota archaeon]
MLKVSGIQTIKIFIFLLLIISCLILFLTLKNPIFFEKKNKSGSMAGNYTKVLIIGIDAMDYKIVNELMREGKLPNFLRLSKLGSFSALETTIPPETPVAWTTAATGVNPGKHGVIDFIIRDPNTYLPEISITKQKFKNGLIFESPIKSVPFWKITSDAGVPTDVIRWPATFPPEKINGVMLSGLGVPDIRGFESGYYLYASDLSENSSPHIIHVSMSNGIINSVIKGPLSSNMKPIEKSIKIVLDKNNITIFLDAQKYEVKVNEWSDWIKIDFNVGFLKQVSAITKVYLLSIEPNFRLYMTSIQFNPERTLVDISYPRDYSYKLSREIGLFYTLGMPEDTNALNDYAIPRKVFLDQINQIESERTKMFFYEFNKFKQRDSGVLAFGFDAGDRLQHVNWDDKNIFNFSKDFLINEAIINYYTQKDELIGKVLDSIDNNTALIIFSDHGFTSFERAVNINTWLMRNGFLTLKKNISENDAGELFKYVDWNKTQAYSVGFSGIYLNLKGREKNGIVDPENKEILIDEIIMRLKDFKDPKTNRTIIKKVYKSTDIYSGDYVFDSPDILIGFEPGYRMAWQSVIGGFTSEVIMDNTKLWNGDHIVDYSEVPGVLFTNFPINKKNPSLIDIAPTILDILKINYSQSFEGKSLLQ